MKQDTLVRTVMRDFRLPPDGLHGPAHWARVLENGLRLAETVKVDRRVLEAFAVLHDALRVCDGLDRDHGRRAAALAWRLRRRLGLEPADIRRLQAALAGHDEAMPDPGDDTVRVCWDAERLDLARLGITPRPTCLYTEAARDRGTIGWACERSCRNEAPEEVLRHWGLADAVKRARAQ